MWKKAGMAAEGKVGSTLTSKGIKNNPVLVYEPGRIFYDACPYACAALVDVYKII